MIYLNSSKKEQCTGCTACANICPVKAITMKEDKEGFKYPEIDEIKCIKCGLCEKLCFNVNTKSDNSIIETYGVKHKNEEERMSSRSGGIFVSLSDYILNLNGSVYGAVLNEDFTVTHERAENKVERNRFKGSKYVQSDMKDIIQKIKKDLEKGKKVLFSGTACQVSAVKQSVNQKYQENLFTCDLICHGVPSPKVFNDYLNYIEEKENKKIKKFNFRDKKFGWSSHLETFIFEDGTEISNEYFKNLFYRHNILRPSCYNCKFANTHRPADITIADFWGVEDILPKFSDEKGVSLVIINNEKGRQWFKDVTNDLEFIECDTKKCIDATYTLNKPTPISKNRKEFWDDYYNNDFEYIIEKYAK